MTTKAQAAIDLNLMNREEAAEYLNISVTAFSRVAPSVEFTRIGRNKYYAKQSLLDFLTKIRSN